MKSRQIKRGPGFPAPSYRDAVLAPAFEQAKRYLLQPLLAVEQAHLLMLAKQEIVKHAEVAQCLQALDRLDLAGIRDADYDGSVEDLVFYIDRELASRCGVENAGKMRVARSRNDLDVTVYRMILRDLLARTMQSLAMLREQLICLAWEHRAVVMPAYTHNQPAQPTTLGHYLMAVIEILSRDMERARAAYGRVNRSPLGACAITTTGFPISRSYTAQLLGFDGLQMNSYGAIASVDYLTEACSVLAVCMINVGRLAQDLLMWSTAEVGYLRLSDGYVQRSSIMPQKRNPVSLEHMRALASRAMMQSQAVLGSVHNTPFADMNDSGDGLQPLISSAFEDGIRSLTLAAGVMEEAEFLIERMTQCAEKNFLTATELADTLVRSAGMSFQMAHDFVGKALKELQGNSDAERIIVTIERILAEHQPSFQVDPKILRDSIDATHFIAVRNVPGSPMAAALEPEIEKARVQLKADIAWLAERREQLQKARAFMDSEKNKILVAG